MKDKLSTIRLIIRPKACLRELEAINHVDGDMRNATQYRIRKQRLSQLEDVLRMQKNIVNVGGFSTLLLVIPHLHQWLAEKTAAWSALPQIFLRLSFVFLLTGVLIYAWNAGIRWTARFETLLEKMSKAATGAKTTETAAHKNELVAETAELSSERTLLRQFMAGFGSREGRLSLITVIAMATIAAAIFHFGYSVFTATPSLEYGTSDITTPAFLLRATIALLPLLFITIFAAKAVWHLAKEAKRVSW